MSTGILRAKGRVSLHNGQPVVFSGYDPDTVALIKTLPSATWLPAIRGWRVLRNELALLEDMGFDVPSELIPKFRIDGFKADLFPYQIEGVMAALKRGKVLIADEMGLGKTAQALAFLQVRKDLRPAVIVCPATLKLNWLQEINKFLDDSPENTVSVLSGKKPEKADTCIQIINYDILEAWLPVLKPKAVIGDEAHYLKNSQSGRSGAFKKICKGTEAVLLLTGTPVLNRPMDLHPLVQLLAPRLFEDKTAFGIKYCGGQKKPIPIKLSDVQPGDMVKLRPDDTRSSNDETWATVARKIGNNFAVRVDGSTKDVIVKPELISDRRRMVWDFSGCSNLDELNRILQGSVMIRRLKKDVLSELPPVAYASVPVELSDPDTYSRAEHDFIAWLRGEISRGVYDGAKLSAALKARAITQIECLKQIAAKGKLNIAIDWVKDFLESGEKLVLFVHHKSVGEGIVGAFPGCAVLTGGMKDKDKMSQVNKFQTDPQCNLFVGSIQAAGIGLTLTAASNVAMLEFPWRPTDLDQAVSRCHRIGQKSSVTAWCLVAVMKGVETIDQRILKTLQAKQEIADVIIDGKVSGSQNIIDDILEGMVS